jgi:ABC transporter transmembrane region 2
VGGISFRPFLTKESADVLMPPLPRDFGAFTPVTRAMGAFPAVEFMDRTMSRSRDTVRPVCGGDGDRPRAANNPANDDKGCVEEPESRKPTLPNPESIEGGLHDLVHQCHELLNALWLSPGRRSLALLTIGTVLVVCATAAAQVGLNAWNRPFYEAIAKRNFPAFSYQLLVFAAIAASLLGLNVAQAWLREMIKLQSREWLTCSSWNLI